mmetsp:Transcript_21273/g.28969  ORF Transcript_21273/g.28969 Transcript_21273/m.28969 type:complete len:173 (-) Transcript_21273:595-1113(-)
MSHSETTSFRDDDDRVPRTREESFVERDTTSNDLCILNRGRAYSEGSLTSFPERNTDPRLEDVLLRRLVLARANGEKRQRRQRFDTEPSWLLDRRTPELPEPLPQMNSLIEPMCLLDCKTQENSFSLRDNMVDMRIKMRMETSRIRDLVHQGKCMKNKNSSIQTKKIRLSKR